MAELYPTHENGFRPASLPKRGYTNALAAEAKRIGIYDEDDILHIQTGLMNTLAIVIGYASRGESTSVRLDRANDYMQCILYNCDTYLYGLGDHGKAAEYLRSIPMEEMYNRGFAMNRDYHREAKKLFATVLYNRILDGSNTYKRAVDILLPHYLDAYDPRFNAQDKLYMSIPSMGIKGPFHIDDTVIMLEKLLVISKGRKSDLVLDNP